jgi:hypothetical protein
MPSPVFAERSRDTEGRLVLRVLLVIAGFLLVWVMESRWHAAREQYARAFEWPMLEWLLLLGSGVLAGLAFGLACCLPTRFGGYRPGRVLAMGIPSLGVLAVGIVFLADLSAVNDLPRPLGEVVFRLVGAGGPFFQPVAAIVLGIALASGFAEPRPRTAATGFGGTSPPAGFEQPRERVPTPPPHRLPSDPGRNPPPAGPPPPGRGAPWGRPDGEPG